MKNPQLVKDVLALCDGQDFNDITYALGTVLAGVIVEGSAPEASIIEANLTNVFKGVSEAVRQYVKFKGAL